MMVASLSLPNWREDQPGPDVLESEKAVQTGLPTYSNPMAPAYIGIPAMVRQRQNQQDYQNYFNTISALQQRNMNLQQQENQVNALDKLSTANAAVPGTWSNVAPSLGGLVPQISPEAAENARRAFDAKNQGLLLRGAGQAALGGFQFPGGLNVPVAAGEQPQVLPQGAPAVAQAAAIRGDAEKTAAGIRAGATGGTTVQDLGTVGPDGVFHPAQRTITNKTPAGGTRASGGPPGLSSAIPSAPGSTGDVGQGNPLLGSLAQGGNVGIDSPAPASVADNSKMPPVAQRDTDALKATVQGAVARAAALPDKSSYNDMTTTLKSGNPKVLEQRPDGSVWLHGKQHDYMLQGPH
jgi:hypothetical protein